MKTPHVAFAMFRSVALGGAWIAYDDGFARHRKIVGREEEFRTIAIRSRSDADSAMFSLCAEPVRVNCVVDGDTLRFKGEKIRIVDIDAPETSKPACPAERQAGEEARDRLVAFECRIVLDDIRLARPGSIWSHAAHRCPLRDFARGDACRGEPGSTLGRAKT